MIEQQSQFDQLFFWAFQWTTCQVIQFIPFDITHDSFLLYPFSEQIKYLNFSELGETLSWIYFSKYNKVVTVQKKQDHSDAQPVSEDRILYEVQKRTLLSFLLIQEDNHCTCTVSLIALQPSLNQKSVDLVIWSQLQITSELSWDCSQQF